MQLASNQINVDLNFYKNCKHLENLAHPVDFKQNSISTALKNNHLKSIDSKTNCIALDSISSGANESYSIQQAKSRKRRFEKHLNSNYRLSYKEAKKEKITEQSTQHEITSACEKVKLNPTDLKKFIKKFLTHQNQLISPPVSLPQSKKQLRILIKQTNADGLTLLHYAVQQEEPEIVALLLELGANINSLDDNSKTPLLYAIENEQRQIVKSLKMQGADLDFIIDDGLTPLNFAIQSNQPEMAKLLIELGADVNLSTPKMMTPLRLAIKKNQFEMVKLLVKHGADVNLIDKTQRTPLGFAVEVNLPEMIVLLEKLGANADLLDGISETPVDVAARGKNPDLLFLLNHLDANIDLPDESGCTPLYKAEMEGAFEGVEILKSLGADVELSKQIQMIVELAHIWGLKGLVEIKDNIKVDLEGMWLYGAGKLLSTYVHNFFQTISEDSRISNEDLIKIQEAVARVYPYSRESAGEIVDALKNDQPYIFLGGWSGHAVGIVFCKGKLIICNRGCGRGAFACQIYKLPVSMLTEKIIRGFKKKYSSKEAFKKMLSDLNLTEKGGYQQKPQEVGNCSWANAKAAFGVLCRQYANTCEEGYGLYKDFTAFCREDSLKNYLKNANPRSIKLLKLINKKLPEKNGLKSAKKALSRTFRKLQAKSGTAIC